MLNALLSVYNLCSRANPDNIPDGSGGGLDIDIGSFIAGVIIGVLCMLFIFGVIKLVKLSMEDDNEKIKDSNTNKKS